MPWLTLRGVPAQVFVLNFVFTQADTHKTGRLRELLNRIGDPLNVRAAVCAAFGASAATVASFSIGGHTDTPLSVPCR